MSLTMTQQGANVYVGTEVIVESNSTLTKGTATKLDVREDFIFLSLKDTSWKPGTLDSLHVGKWKETASQSTTQVLLSTKIESSVFGNEVLCPTPQGTRALLFSE